MLLNDTTWIAHKFGGSSMANAERIAHVGKLLLAREERAQVTSSPRCRASPTR
jgi:aspartokinase